MSAPSLVGYPEGGHAFRNALNRAELESRIEEAEMEKHAHGPLTDEAAIMARDGATTDAGRHSAVSSMLEEREVDSERTHSFRPEWSLPRDSPAATGDNGEAARQQAKKRAEVVEQSEVDKHAQGRLQDEASIKAVDAAHMREGKRATMVRHTENEKHAHGHLEDERRIIDAAIPTALP
jgi:hypothetical protein